MKVTEANNIGKVVEPEELQYPHNKIIIEKFPVGMTGKPDHVLIHGEEYYVENHLPDGYKVQEIIESAFPGQGVKYLGYWEVHEHSLLVFHSLNPNRSLGHKSYPCIGQYLDGGHFVTGFDQDEMEKYSKQSGRVCRHCKTVIWSLYRHDYHYCQCLPDKVDRVGVKHEMTEEEVAAGRKLAVSIDGGMNYTRGSSGENSDSYFVGIDHLNKLITRTIKEIQDGKAA